ncbi:LytTR family DNA-binding domain-containing protein [Enterococcus hirae]
MRIKFEIDNHIAQDTVKVTTHSSCEKTWGRIKEAILTTEQTIVVIDAKTNKKVSRLLSDVSSIESKEQMCHVVFTSNERYLLAVRLKIVEKQFTSYGFVRINISTLVNRSFIKAFRSTDNARVEIEMKNGSKFIVNRHYEKKFKEMWV